MSSCKTLKIIDYSLVRSARNNAREDVSLGAGSIDDQLRKASNRYYRDYIPKKTRDGRFIKKKTDYFIYGDPEGMDRTKMSFANSLISEIHYGESRERCSSRLYESVQSVRIVGHAGYLSNDEHWKAFVEGGEALVTNYEEIPGPDGDPIPEELIGSSEDDADVEFEGGSPPAYGEVYRRYNGVVKLDKVFYDHCMSISLPFSKKETDLLYGNVGYNYGNIDYVYNFLQTEYETAIGQGNVSEKVLPNLYVVMSAFNDESNLKLSKYFKKHVTLNNALPLPIYKRMKMPKFSDDPYGSKCKTASRPGGMKIEYLRDWSNIGLPRYLNINEFNQNALAGSLERRFSNILIPEKNINLINDYNTNKEMFPMYSEISFTTDTSTEIAETFSNLNLNCLLMKGMYELLTDLPEDFYSAGSDVEGEELPEEDADGWWTAMAGTQAGEVTGTDDVADARLESDPYRRYRGADDDAPRNPCSTMGNMSVYRQRFYTQTDAPVPSAGSTACDPRIKIVSDINVGTYRMMDLKEWMDYFHSNLSTPIANSAVFFGQLQRGMHIAENPTTEYEKNFLMTVLRSKIQTIIQNNMRDYGRIIDGNPARSETLMYRISKRRGKNGPVIQNYWISNSNKIDMFNFIDTQVKYNREYEYQVYAYQVVIGAKYAYKNLAISRTLSEEPNPCIELFDAKTGEPVAERVPFSTTRNPITRETKMIPVKKRHRYIAEFDAVVRPSVKIVEVPYMNTSAFIVDSPPMPPDINIVPYLYVKDRINIFLNNGVGRESALPIFINSKLEGPRVRRYAMSKGLSPGEPIVYESDDTPSGFMIFRTTIRPSSYGDFNGKLHKSIDVSQKNEGPLITQHTGREGHITDPLSSIAFDDKITANKKYYYTFKTIDYHGNISNPSPVYEVEIVNDQGASYFLMNTIEFEVKEPRKSSIMGKRLLQIIPNINQTLINEEASGFEDAETAKQLRNKIVLGLNKVGVWDKRFKFRLTSTKTGRKIDLNIKFVPQHKATKSDFEC